MVLFYGLEYCWFGVWGEVFGQYCINMFEFIIGVKGVNYGVDLFRIDRDICDVGVFIVV